MERPEIPEAEKYRFAVIVNYRKINKDEVSTLEKLERIDFDNHPDNVAGQLPIPMFGYRDYDKESIYQKKFVNLGIIPLLRATAKIELIFDSEFLKTFELDEDEICLRSYNIRSRVTPKIVGNTASSTLEMDMDDEDLMNGDFGDDNYKFYTVLYGNPDDPDDWYTLYNGPKLYGPISGDDGSIKYYAYASEIKFEKRTDELDNREYDKNPNVELSLLYTASKENGRYIDEYHKSFHFLSDANLTSIKRNHLYRVNITYYNLDIQTELDILPWTLKETEANYSTATSPEFSCGIDSKSNSTRRVEKGTVRRIDYSNKEIIMKNDNDSDVKAEFKVYAIDNDKVYPYEYDKHMWTAMFEVLEGDPGAFVFIDEKGNEVPTISGHPHPTAMKAGSTMEQLNPLSKLTIRNKTNMTAKVKLKVVIARPFPDGNSYKTIKNLDWTFIKYKE